LGAATHEFKYLTHCGVKKLAWLQLSNFCSSHEVDIHPKFFGFTYNKILMPKQECFQLIELFIDFSDGFEVKIYLSLSKIMSTNKNKLFFYARATFTSFLCSN
jgi:hypothetical protein